MFFKTALVILTTALIGLVLGLPIDNFSQNVEKSLENLQRVNCMVNSVINLDDAADEFSYVIKNGCGEEAVNNLRDEIAKTKELMRITDKIDKINDGPCDNGGYNEELDADETPNTKCVNKLKAEMANLLTSFTKTKTAIDNALTQSYTSGACVKMAASNFGYFLDSFPSRIEVCAGLGA